MEANGLTGMLSGAGLLLALLYIWTLNQRPKEVTVREFLRLDQAKQDIVTEMRKGNPYTGKSDIGDIAEWAAREFVKGASVEGVASKLKVALDIAERRAKA